MQIVTDSQQVRIEMRKKYLSNYDRHEISLRIHLLFKNLKSFKRVLKSKYFCVVQLQFKDSFIVQVLELIVSLLFIID